MTETEPRICGHVRQYKRSKLFTGHVCRLPEGHKPVEKHTDGRVRWTEPVTVLPNRRDVRKAVRG